MITGELTSQPIGHYDFCRANRVECSIRAQNAGPLNLNDPLLTSITNINTAVNTAIKPRSDFDIYGRDEVWAYPVQGVGDCEDYVLEKRRQLAEKGVSLSSLLITVARLPNGDGHAVLTLRTDRGDYILDNLRDEIRLWYQTGYEYLKRQSTAHTGRWVTLRDDHNVLVGSIQK